MNMMYKKASTMLFRCIVLVLGGAFMLLFPRTMESVAQKGSVIALLVLGAIDTTEYLRIKEKFTREGWFKLLSMVVNLGGAVFIAYFPKVYLSLFSMIIGVWVILNAIVRTILFAQYQINKVEGRWFTCCGMLVSYAFGLALLINPDMHISTVIRLLGCYLILFGCTHAEDVFRAWGMRKMGSWRGIRTSRPLLMDAFEPYSMSRRVNNPEGSQAEEERYRKDFDLQKEVQKPDMQVFIHVAPNGYGRFGHMDIEIDGRVVAYGCYDQRTKRFFDLLGDGHMFFVENNVEEYLAFCCYNDNKTIYGYGLQLDEEHKEAVRARIAQMEKVLSPYVCDTQLARQGKLPNDRRYDDYASRLYRATGAKIYHVVSGRYKTYYSIGTNCVTMANSFIGAAGLDMVKLMGVITPGTYYDYFNTQIQLENSNVISRKVYTKSNQQGVFHRFVDRLEKHEEGEAI